MCPPSPIHPVGTAERLGAARRGGAPLPIPNREVKPRSGDDTAGDRGKVARRPPTTGTLPERPGRVSCFYGRAAKSVLRVRDSWTPFPIPKDFFCKKHQSSGFSVFLQLQKGAKPMLNNYKSLIFNKIQRGGKNLPMVFVHTPSKAGPKGFVLDFFCARILILQLNNK